MVTKPAFNVGIGTTAPGERLAVSGNVSATYVKAGADYLTGTAPASVIPSLDASKVTTETLGGARLPYDLGDGNLAVTGGNLIAARGVYAKTLQGNLAVSNVVGIAQVAVTGSYNDLSDKPFIGTAAGTGTALGLAAGALALSGTAVLMSGDKSILYGLGSFLPGAYEAFQDGINAEDAGKDDNSRTEVISYLNLTDRPIAVRDGLGIK